MVDLVDKLISVTTGELQVESNVNGFFGTDVVEGTFFLVVEPPP